MQQIGIAEDAPFLSYFAGNVIQICPVGALTSEDYRFRSRPFDLVSTPGVAEHDACGSRDPRRPPARQGDAPPRGQRPQRSTREWITDKDRFAFHYATGPTGSPTPGPRPRRGRWRRQLRPASWPGGLRGRRARPAGGGATGVLTGGRITAEDGFAYSKFARVALGTNDIDFRSRPLSAEETAFLAAEVVHCRQRRPTPTSSRRPWSSPGSEPEDEAGAVFLRLRKATGTPTVSSVAPGMTPPGLAPERPPAADGPRRRGRALESLVEHARHGVDKNSIILVGERLATSPGALAAARHHRRPHRRPAGLGAAPRR